MNKRRRRILLLSIAAIFVAVAVAVWLARPHPPASMITWENVNKVEKDMPRAAVEALLGGAPRDEGDYSRWAVWMSGHHPGVEFVEWVGPQAAVAVCFDDRGHVIQTEIAVVAPPSRSVLDLVRRAAR
jgi:hypothetical protein